jgi:hypothetical protein
LFAIGFSGASNLTLLRERYLASLLMVRLVLSFIPAMNDLSFQLGPALFDLALVPTWSIELRNRFCDVRGGFCVMRRKPNLTWLHHHFAGVVPNRSAA